MKRLLLLSALFLVSVLGCGRDGPERVVVRGRVTFQGHPVKRGTIRFLPTEGTTALTAGAPILDGKYAAEKQGGISVGTHRVEIEAFHDFTGCHPDPDLQTSGSKQYLPARYNKKSNLTLTILSGSGAITKDFDLTR